MPQCDLKVIMTYSDSCLFVTMLFFYCFLFIISINRQLKPETSDSPLKASACCSIDSLTIFQKHSDTAMLRFSVVI